MLYSVDRIEGSLAVLIDDDEESRVVPLSELPPDTGEGDMLRLDEDGYHKDPEAAAARVAEILALQDALRQQEE